MVDRSDHAVLAMVAEQAHGGRGESEAAPLYRGEAAPASDQNRQQMAVSKHHCGVSVDLVETIEERADTTADLLDRLTIGDRVSSHRPVGAFFSDVPPIECSSRRLGFVSTTSVRGRSVRPVCFSVLDHSV